jgi:hypothetical protein
MNQFMFQRRIATTLAAGGLSVAAGSQAVKCKDKANNADVAERKNRM